MVQPDHVLAVEGNRGRWVRCVPKGDQGGAVAQEDRGIVWDFPDLSKTKRIDEERARLGQVWNGQSDVMSTSGNGSIRHRSTPWLDAVSGPSGAGRPDGLGCPDNLSLSMQGQNT